MSKFEIAISAVFFGFVLSQVVDLLKYKWQIFRKKIAISEEIEGLSIELDERLSRIESILESLNSNHLVGALSPSVIPITIYEYHYAEVAPFFSAAERKAISQLYSCVKNYNDDAIKTEFSDISAKKLSLLELYYHSLMGKNCAEYFIKFGSKKLLSNDDEKLDMINKEVNLLASKYIQCS